MIICGLLAAAAQEAAWTRTVNLNMSDPSQLCPVNGAYELTAQNRGGYVEGASVVQAVPRLYTALTVSATARFAEEWWGFSKLTAPDAFGGSTESLCGWGIPHTRTSWSKTTHLELCCWKYGN